MNPLDRVDAGWAWTQFAPSAEQPWNAALAAHLFRRAGFAATWQELKTSESAGMASTVDMLLTGGDVTAFYAQADSTIDSLLSSNNGLNLPAWWLHVMLQTPHPLLEKMTLFWHGHFATSASKVTDGRLMVNQNRLLRQHALGKFGPLLEGMAKDPAMLLWLDSATNRKSRPNENFAREVMELFSLGLGHYTEHDIKEAARAFTGFEVRQGEFRFNRYQHDMGKKEVLGREGAWTGEDVIRILLTDPKTAAFLVRKIYRFLVSEVDPPDALIAPLAEAWASHEYDTGWLVRTILSSNLFYSSHSVRQKIKSPVEFALGLVRSLEGNINAYAMAEDLGALGQSVFFPPNVKGWDGGSDWINASTLLSRANLAWAIVGGSDGRHQRKVSIERLAALADVRDAAQGVRRLADLLLAAPLPESVLVQLTSLAADNAGDDRLRRARVIHAIATLPEYQLA